MIDIHTHILPGLDDGSPNIEESLAMARIAIADGIDTIIATPHVLSGVYDNTPEQISQAVDQLNTILQAEGLPLEILPGSECHLEPDLPSRLAEGRLMTLNNTGRYLLVELPTSMVPDYTGRILYEIQLQGVIPIIAHPERNTEIIRHPDLLIEYARRGVLSQVTTASLVGHFGKTVKKAAAILITTGTAQFIASDAHSSKHRTPVISPATQELQALGGPDLVKTLLEKNPEKIQNGTPIEPTLNQPTPSPWFRFLRR
jgi:protein-tyrosine phosphatase